MKKDLQKKPQLLSGAIVLVVLGFTAGCGGGGNAGDPASEMTEDQQSIEVVVGSVADSAGDVRRLRELFTKESAPTATMAQKYKSRMFQIDYDSEITVSGDTATMNVKVFTYDDPPTETVETWKAQKVGDDWKLSDAPL